MGQETRHANHPPGVAQFGFLHIHVLITLQAPREAPLLEVVLVFIKFSVDVAKYVGKRD